MNKSNDGSEIYKLSEAMKENDEIISDVNNFINDIGEAKALNQITVDRFLNTGNELIMDLDDIIGCIEICEKINDPNLKSFGSNKNSAKLKAQNSKKLLEESLSKLNKLRLNNHENVHSKNKEFLNSNIDKNLESRIMEAPTNLDNTHEESFFQTIIENEPTNTFKKSKVIDKNLSSDVKQTYDRNINVKNEVKEDMEGNSKIDDKGENIFVKKNSENSKQKGILKSHGKKNKNKFEDRKDKLTTNLNFDNERQESSLLNTHDDSINSERLSLESGEMSPHMKKSLGKNKFDLKKLDNKKYKNENTDLGKKLDLENSLYENQIIKSLDYRNGGPDNELETRQNLKADDNNFKENKKKGEKFDKKEDKVLKKKKSIKNKSNVEKNTNLEFKQKNQIEVAQNSSPIKIRNDGDYSDDYENLSDSSVKDDKVGSMVQSQVPEIVKVETKTETSNSFIKMQKSKNSVDDNLGQYVGVGKPFVITKSFSAEGEDDLNGIEGDTVWILEFTDDDWYYAKNNQGKFGFVPKSCIKSKLVNEIGQRELNSILNEENTLNEIQNIEGATLWNQIKQSMQEKSTSKPLKSFGDFPPGFRYSTLYNWSHENSHKTSIVAYLYPKLSESHMSYCDLELNQIRLQPVKIQSQIQIIKVVQLPLISDQFVVKSRHVRLCLFNDNKVISNIHTIRASVNEKDLRTWNFASKISDTTKSLDYNDIFLRFNDSSIDISILLEFCVLGFKSKVNSSNVTSHTKLDETFSDDELVELSTGWTVIPLYESNGRPINNKKGEYIINGGTPFEKGVELDPQNKSGSGSGSKFTIGQNKQPQVTVRIYVPNKENREMLETLPNVIIGSSLNLAVLSFYRRILTEEILNYRIDLTSAKPVYSPFLVSIMESMKYSDFLDILRITWNEKLRISKSINKKDYVKMNELFKCVFMDYIYPLTKLNNFPDLNLARPNSEQIRIDLINQFTKQVKQDNLSVLLSDEYAFAPLSFEELDFNMISKFSESIKA